MMPNEEELPQKDSMGLMGADEDAQGFDVACSSVIGSTPPRGQGSSCRTNLPPLPLTLTVGSVMSPSRLQHSVGTQHDEQTYAQWFYTEVRPLAAPPHALPQVNVGPKRKRHHPAAAETQGTTDGFPLHRLHGAGCVIERDLVADGVLRPPVQENDFTPDRRVPGVVLGPHGNPRVGLDDEGDDAVVGLAQQFSSDEVSSQPTACSDSTEGEDEEAGSELSAGSASGSPGPHRQQDILGRPMSVALHADSAPSSKNGVPSGAAPRPKAVGEDGSRAGAAAAVADGRGQMHHVGRSGPSNFVASCLCPPLLAAELEAYALLRLQLRQDEQRDRSRYISLIERVVQNVLGKRASVTVHGSFATGVALQSSDIDVLVANYEPVQPLVAIERVSHALFGLESYDIPDHSGSVVLPSSTTPADPLTSTAEFPSDPSGQRQRSSISEGIHSPAVTPSTTPTTSTPAHQGGSLFDPHASMMRHGPILSVQTIVATRVPVVKVREILTGHRCDISFGGGEHFPSMELTKRLLEQHPSSRSLLLLMKHFIKKMQIGESEPGGITSFPLYLLAIHWYEQGIMAVHQLRRGSPAAPPTIAAAPVAAPRTSAPLQDEERRDCIQKTLQQAFEGSEQGRAGAEQKSQASEEQQQTIVNTIGSFLYEPDRTTSCSGGDEAASMESRVEAPAAEVKNQSVVAPPSTIGSSPPFNPTGASVEASLTVGQVVLDFCIYYAYLFDYDRHGLRFAPDGTSTVVDKPPQCNARGQHLHMTGPFDSRSDITARMSHTREFQAMCGGVATILSGGTLSHLLSWVSPESIHDDLHAVYHYLQAAMPHVYPPQQQGFQGHPHYASMGHRHPHHSGAGGHRHHHQHGSGGTQYAASASTQASNHQMNILVGQGGQQRRPHSYGQTGGAVFQDPNAPPPTSNGSMSIVPGEPTPVGLPATAAVAARSPQLGGIGYANPYARSSTPVLHSGQQAYSSGGGPDTPPYAAALLQQQQQQQLHLHSTPAVTTGTMTTLPQAPPIQPPPMSSGCVSAARGGGPTMFSHALVGNSNGSGGYVHPQMYAQHAHAVSPQGVVLQAGYATPPAPPPSNGPPPPFVGAGPVSSVVRRGSFNGGVVSASEHTKCSPGVVESTVVASAGSQASTAEPSGLSSSQEKTTKPAMAPPSSTTTGTTNATNPKQPAEAPPAVPTTTTTTSLAATKKPKPKKASKAATAAVQESSPVQHASVPAGLAGSNPQQPRAQNAPARAPSTAAASQQPTIPAVTGAASKKKKKSKAPAVEPFTAPTESIPRQALPTQTSPPSTTQASKVNGDHVSKREIHEARQGKHTAQPDAPQPGGTQQSSSHHQAGQGSSVVATVVVSAAKYVPPFRRMQLEEQQKQEPT